VKRAADLAVLVLLVLAVLQAVLLAFRPPPGRSFLALFGRGENPALLSAEGGAERAVASKVAAVGDYLTIEDLVRGTLLLEEGRLPGVQALSPGERKRVATLMATATAHRDELLATEAELAANEEALRQEVQTIVLGLSPEQKAWILAQRDAVSVGRIERGYWTELGAMLASNGGSGAAAPAPAGAAPAGAAPAGAAPSGAAGR
jgi:hypothetical protein